MTDGFSYNFESDDVTLKTFYETLQQNIKLKGTMPHKCPEIIIDNETRRKEEEDVLNKVSDILFGNCS